MKYLITSIFLIISIQGFTQVRHERDLHEQHNEVIDDPYMPRNHHSMRAANNSYKITSASSVLSTIVTTQVNVDSLGNDITLEAANEPSIAINPLNPNNIVIGWRQFDNILSNFRQAGYSFSTDGGATWAAENVIQPGVFRSDPVLDCDSAGNFYYNSLSHDTAGTFICHVFKSTNGGASWDTGTYANGGDKQWMVIDKEGVGESNFYTCWSSNNTSCLMTTTNFSRSSNGGLSFEPCRFVIGNPVYGTMDIGDSGALYMSGWNAFFSSNDFVFSKCIDPAVAGTILNWNYVYVFMDSRSSTTATVNPGGLIGQINVAAGHGVTGSNNVYLTATVSRFSNSDMGDVMFARSTDGGQTWDPPVRINDDLGTAAQQWMAALSVAPNGRIDAVWLDNRTDITLDVSSLYYSYSYDDGNTWSANERLSGSFDPHTGYPNQSKMGDYFDMISDNVSAHLAWCNTFQEEENIYYSVITPPSPLAIEDSADPPVNIYPNPTAGYIKISSLLPMQGIEVFSIDGSRVLSKEIAGNLTELDLSQLSNGVYFLNLQFGNEKNCVKKLVLAAMEMK